MIGTLQVPGPSPVHDLPAGGKLAILAVLGTAAFVIDRPPVLLAGAVAIIALYPLARVPLRHVWIQARNLAPLLGLMALAQAWFDGPLAAATTLVRVLGLVWAAGLVTATTPFAAMMAVFQRLLAPLRPLGVHPPRAAFALTMAVRFLPLLQGMIEEARAALRARALGRNPLTLAVPLTLRALRLADRVAEAVEARDVLADEPGTARPPQRRPDDD